MKTTSTHSLQPHVSAPGDAATVRYIYGARALRDFGDGFIAILLPVYLTAIGLGPLEVGIVATLALLGSALMTLGIGLLGAAWDRRKLLMAASALMAATGVAFAFSSTYGAILLIAFIGTINPSAGSVSIFVPLEHAALSHAVADADRTSMFARYSLIGALAAALGSFGAATPEFLATLGVSQMTALRVMFVAYAVLGIAGGILYARTSPVATPAAEGATAALGPSRIIVYKMAALFSIDAFAGGFAVQSLIALWLFTRFDLSLYAAGLFFFWSGVLAAFSFPVAAWLSRRIGLVNTMVFTHIPSSVCLMLAAIAPNVETALGAAAGPRGAVANGCADALVLRDGRGDAGGKAGRGQRHLRAAQPGGRCQPGHGRCAVRERSASLAADHMRGAQDPVRHRPALDLPAREAARGALGKSGGRLVS